MLGLCLSWISHSQIGVWWAPDIKPVRHSVQ